MRLSGWQVPIEHLSASSLAMFVECPEKWRLRRLQKVPESTGVDKWIGIVDHETHAQNFTQKISVGRDLPPTEMESVYDKTWERELDEIGEVDWRGEDADETRSHGHLIMQTYHEFVSPSVNPIAVETRFEETLPDVPIPIVGYVDIEEDKRLLERKTTKARQSKPKPGWLLQGRLYSMIFQKPVEWHVVTRAKTPALCLPEENPELRLESGDNADGTLMLIQQIAYQLNDTYLRYGPDHPWPTTGLLHPFMCSMCFAGPKYQFRCPAWKGSE